ncbi:MAG: cytochrome c [Bdellovibrionales bacterium]|nr:cytochrome c [Bdellovibrionales bacterium]
MSLTKTLPYRSPLIALVAAALLLAGCSGSSEKIKVDPTEKAYVPRGRALVQGLAACGQCHGSKSNPRAALSGGQKFSDIYGEVFAPNLTSSKIKRWSAADFVSTFRKHSTPEDRELAVEHHRGYEWMADEDAFAIAAYIRSLPTVMNDVEIRDLSSVTKYTTGILENRVSVEGYVPAIPRREIAAYGKYLVDHVARCSSCHNKPETLFGEEDYLAGGREISRNGVTKIAPNITGSETFGIGEWSEDEIIRFLSTGKPPGSSFRQVDICPTEFYSLAAPEDLAAIAHYIRSVETNT